MRFCRASGLSMKSSSAVLWGLRLGKRHWNHAIDLLQNLHRSSGCIEAVSDHSNFIVVYGLQKRSLASVDRSKTFTQHGRGAHGCIRTKTSVGRHPMNGIADQCGAARGPVLERDTSTDR